MGDMCFNGTLKARSARLGFHHTTTQCIIFMLTGAGQNWGRYFLSQQGAGDILEWLHVLHKTPRRAAGKCQIGHGLVKGECRIYTSRTLKSNCNKTGFMH